MEFVQKICINCGDLTRQMIKNKCSHYEPLCNECCKLLDNVHINDDYEPECTDNCIDCLDK